MKFKILVLLFIISNVGFSQNYFSEISEFRKTYIDEIVKLFPNQKQDFFKIDEQYAIKAHFIKIKKNKILEFPTSSGKIKHFKSYAILNFEIDGKIQMLTVFQSVPVNPQYKNHLFLPFKDKSNTKATYGGGRYLDLSLDQFKNEVVILDFNKAYNPYCAFSEGYSCPIPPKENELLVEMNAGERVPLTAH